MTEGAHGGEQKARFEPKQAVSLDPPKDDPITVEHLAKCDGRFISPVLTYRPVTCHLRMKSHEPNLFYDCAIPRFDSKADEL
jgi:hypothetical protein